MAIVTFRSRIERARAKEAADTATLQQKFRCVVTPFGQGQLPDEVRDYLRKHPDHVFIRWLPDLMVISPGLYLAKAKEWMWLVDSKDGRTNTENWTLEKAAHEAHRLQRAALGLPIVYIWPDGCSCSYVEDLTDEVLLEGRPISSGSGTPYWLVPKTVTRSLEDVFSGSEGR